MAPDIVGTCVDGLRFSFADDGEISRGPGSCSVDVFLHSSRDARGERVSGDASLDGGLASWARSASAVCGLRGTLI